MHTPLDRYILLSWVHSLQIPLILQLLRSSYSHFCVIANYFFHALFCICGICFVFYNMKKWNDMNTTINSKGQVNFDISERMASTLIRKRKTTVIRELSEKIILTEEMDEGYCFTFSYSDETFFRLAEFINLEKEYCPFFDFNLSMSGSSNTISLSLSGAEGIKNFIKYELEMS
jgi:hypothetical protein